MKVDLESAVKHFKSIWKSRQVITIQTLHLKPQSIKIRSTRSLDFALPFYRLALSQLWCFFFIWFYSVFKKVDLKSHPYSFALRIEMRFNLSIDIVEITADVTTTPRAITISMRATEG